MMTKLVQLSEQNIILSVIIKFFCRCIFLCISSWNELCGILRGVGFGGKKYKSLKSYKNKHDGKRCFIIATGPSLNVNDLELIKKEYSFGMNSLIKIYDETDFRPTYYGIQDHFVYTALKEEIMKYYKNHENVFVSDRITWHEKIGEKWNVFPLNMSYNAYKRWFYNDYNAKFSEDIYRRVYSGFSITYSLIEIAIYMGFKEIYLLGADCDFGNKGKIHFAEYGVIDKTLNTAKERNLAGYAAAKEYAEKHGIKIYNATRGGKLEMFERVDLDKVVCAGENDIGVGMK